MTTERHTVWHADGSRCMSLDCARHHILQPIAADAPAAEAVPAERPTDTDSAAVALTVYLDPSERRNQREHGRPRPFDEYPEASSAEWQRLAEHLDSVATSVAELAKVAHRNAANLRRAAS